MPWRSRRPFHAPPTSADYNIDPPLEDELGAPTVDTNAWEAQPFPQDVEEQQQDQADAEETPLPETCPLCACLDDPLNADPTSVAASILQFESEHFGRVPDYVLFTQMAEAYNERVWTPAYNRHMSNPHLQLTIPVRWTRLIVKRHFECCKHLTTRRRMARLLRQAEQLMDLSYQSVRIMNPITGEVKCDNNATKVWFNHAKAYSDMLIKAKPLLEAETVGTSSLALQKPKDSSSDTSQGIMSALFPSQALVNAPGNVQAFNFGGANPVSHSGDFSSSFSNFETSEHPGKRTNEVSSVPVQVRPFREGYERVCNVGDVLFNLLPGMSSYAAPGAAVSEVIVNLPVVNRVLLQNPDYYKISAGAPAFVGVFRNEMAMSGKEFFVSNTDPHARLFNIDVAGTTKTPNIWRAANYKGVELVRVGCRVGLARCKISSSRSENLKGPIFDSAEQYIPDSKAEMFLPVHYHGEKEWVIDDVLKKYMDEKLQLKIGEKKFVVDLGIVTWLGALKT